MDRLAADRTSLAKEEELFAERLARLDESAAAWRESLGTPRPTTVHELDPRRRFALGDELHLEFGRPGRIGVVVPVGVEMPGEQHAGRRLPRRHPPPVALLAVRRALDTLKKAATQEPVVKSDGKISNGNTMPYIIDAVRAYATVGEICEALKEVYGTYEEVSIT